MRAVGVAVLYSFHLDLVGEGRSSWRVLGWWVGGQANDFPQGREFP